jgi:hypothetical protein
VPSTRRSASRGHGQSPCSTRVAARCAMLSRAPGASSVVKGIEVVVLDSISRSGMGDLNENQSGSKIMDALNGLSESWLAIGHTPRASADHVTGTMQFDAAADLMVKLSSEQEDDGPMGVSLELTKKNDIPYYKPRILALEFDRNLGFVGFREARRGEFPTIEAGRQQSVLQQLKDWTLDQPHGLGSASVPLPELPG